MDTIEERDNQIEAKASRYYLLRRIFLLGTILNFIGLVGTAFIHDRILNAEKIEMTAFWVTVIFFLVYKWASARIQHIETIKYFNKRKECDGEGRS